MRKCMKRNICCIITAAMLLMSGCSGSGSTGTRQGSTNNVESAIQSQIAKEEGEKVVVDDSKGSMEVLPASEDTSANTETYTTEQTTEATTATEAITEAASEEDKNKLLGDPDPNVDVDLTVMGSDMVYATVYDMMAHPDDYIGKKIKIKGAYTSGWYDETAKWYHYCFIKDAAACCQQGLEFTWDDGSHEIEEFPEDGSEIEVEGIFETYKDFEDDPYQYCQLADASLVVLEGPETDEVNQ
jgi:hypothetical protein